VRRVHEGGAEESVISHSLSSDLIVASRLGWKQSFNCYRGAAEVNAVQPYYGVFQRTCEHGDVIAFYGGGQQVMKLEFILADLSLYLCNYLKSF
jgi:hypothetical protein